ncbi:SLBB domain-containing protein [Planktomarina sp.]|nr:SLBB domain-containing protein [Planktomarina sp.]
MKFPKLQAILAAIMFLGMTLGVFAQDYDEQMRLLQNPELLRQLQDRGENIGQAGDGSGVPSAENPVYQNTDNLLRQEEIIVAPNKKPETAKSVVENYFNILTGDDLSMFGSDEFSQGQDNNLLFFNTVGRDYKIAPGDVLKISLRGFLEMDGVHKVSRNGKVTLPSLPPINVVGITTEDVERKVLELLTLGDASAAAYVSLDTGRLVAVQISGGVESPRTVAIPAYTPLSRALAYVGGVSGAGSLRNINLISNDGFSQQIDFYDFLKNPLGGADPVISESSRIFVGDIGWTVAATGFVARPGIYELSVGQNKIKVKNLMKLSATNMTPPGAVLEVFYFDQNGMASSRIVTLDDEVNGGEALNVRFINTRNTNTISVRGAVVEPYEVSTIKSLSLSDLLKGGTVLTREAELSLAIVYGSGFEPYIIDINEVFSSTASLRKTVPAAPGFEVKENSTVYILSRNEYKNFIDSGGKQLVKMPNDQTTIVNRQTAVRRRVDIEKPVDPDQESALANLLIVKKVSIYLDGQLNVVLAPNTVAIGEPKLASLATGFNVYPLYIGFNRYDERTRAWNYLQLKAADLFDRDPTVIFEKNDQLNFYSTDFINQLGSEIVSNEDTLEIGETVNLTDEGSLISIDDAFSATDQGINTLLKSARNIFGAVDRPGAYPIAGSATLSELLSVAGGTVDGADLTEINVINYKVENGRLLAGSSRGVNILNEDPALILLDGQYTVTVPFLINDASSGTISVSGEVLQPGDYIFSRAETLQEVIEKAGGLSRTAYPLGVVLSREAVKEQQREANKLLAAEVEASVLQLAQSDIAGATDQVQAILGFADRLRNQEVLGRLTVNVLVSDPSAPIFLEDGDKVYVPKRPSYVSVIGAVQKETMASYSSNKTFPDYIAAAGGLSSGADKKSIYVLLPNGESLKATKDVVVPPGAVVVVPPKTDKLSILGLTDIISRVMGNIATSVLAINNVN